MPANRASKPDNAIVSGGIRRFIEQTMSVDSTQLREMNNNGANSGR
jgi:hypothetical protein